MLQTLRAEEGLDERLAVGIGITLRRDEAGEDGRTGDEGRNVSGKKKRFQCFFSKSFLTYLTYLDLTNSPLGILERVRE